MTWQTLAQSGVTVRGPRLSNVSLATNPTALASWLRGNLNAYWRTGWQESSKADTAAHEAALRPENTAWTVLGVTRLHYTLATGAITSKTGAGEYALQTFDDCWHPIVRDALAIRAGRNPSQFDSAQARRAAMLDFCDMVINDALA